jgi:hypothetical protein
MNRTISLFNDSFRSIVTKYLNVFIITLFFESYHFTQIFFQSYYCALESERYTTISTLHFSPLCLFFFSSFQRINMLAYSNLSTGKYKETFLFSYRKLLTERNSFFFVLYLPVLS